MAGLDETLGMFLSALELESDLETGAVDFDRSLLRPPAAQTPPPAVQSAPQPAPQPVERPGRTQKPEAAPVRKAADGKVFDFAFILPRIPEGEAGELLRKMRAAMGCTDEDSAVLALGAERPKARLHVLMGRETVDALKRGMGLKVGSWTSLDGAPAIVTYDPAIILKYYREESERTKAKMETWRHLREALSRLGRTPPAGNG